MTESTRVAGFVEDLGPLFKPWADADGRECLSADLAEKGAEEMAEELRQAERVIDGLHEMAEEAFGFGAFLILGDARAHAARARKVAEGYAKRSYGGEA
jgi:hypothetical protein